MVVRKDSLAHERLGDGDAKTLGETNYRFAGVIAHGAVSRKQDGALRGLQNLRGTRYLSRRRRCITHDIDLEWMMPRRHGHFFYIFWQCQIDGARTFGLRKLERLPNHLRHSFRSRDEFSPFRARLEHAH